MLLSLLSKAKERIKSSTIASAIDSSWLSSINYLDILFSNNFFILSSASTLHHHHYHR